MSEQNTVSRIKSACVKIWLPEAGWKALVFPGSHFSSRSSLLNHQDLFNLGI